MEEAPPSPRNPLMDKRCAVVMRLALHQLSAAHRAVADPPVDALFQVARVQDRSSGLCCSEKCAAARWPAAAGDDVDHDSLGDGGERVDCGLGGQPDRREAAADQIQGPAQHLVRGLCAACRGRRQRAAHHGVVVPPTGETHQQVPRLRSRPVRLSFIADAAALRIFSLRRYAANAVALAHGAWKVVNPHTGHHVETELLAFVCTQVSDLGKFEVCS